MIRYHVDSCGFYSEECCDYCKEPIHSHFNCPLCSYEGAGTDYITDYTDIEIGETFYCKECSVEYEFISKHEFISK